MAAVPPCAPRNPSHLPGAAMNIFANTVVTMTFELFDSEGNVLEATS